MSTRLISLDGGPDIPLGEAPIVVGRQPGCDTRLHSLQVSRCHCCLVANGGELVVRDLGSTNGTWINGRRVVSGRLRPGDELMIGDLRYRIPPAVQGEERASGGADPLADQATSPMQ